MRTLCWLTAALLAASLPAAAIGVEVEVAPGAVGGITDDGGAGGGFALTGRLGVQTDWLTPSLVGFLAPFGPDVMRHGLQPGGFRGWAVLAELRAHNPGDNQVSIGGGVGWGLMDRTQMTDGDFESYQGVAAPYVEVVAGYRHQGSWWRVGADLTIHFFNRVTYVSDVGAGYRGRMVAFGLSLTLGFKAADI